MRTFSGKLNSAGGLEKPFGEEQLSSAGVVPRDSDIQRAEEQNMTVVQMDSELPVSQTIIDIAKRIMLQ